MTPGLHLHLPKVVNCNPQSLYNKKDEFVTFVKQREIDLTFISESFERESWPLSDLLEDLTESEYTIISNVHQRREKGGRPGLVVNNKNYHVQNLTQSVINVPWGCEIVWCVLTPKNIQKDDDKIQKIVCGSFYSKPGSKYKSKLLDHISDTYNYLSTKYKKGLHWILARDANDLKLDSLLSLDPNMKQVVQDQTRLRSKPPGILDPILTTLSDYYQRPICLPPLRSDSQMSESDHLIVFMEPISAINNKPARQLRHVTVRRYPISQMTKFGDVLKIYDWSELYEAETSHKKAEILQKSLLDQLNFFMPEKIVTFSNSDKEYFTPELKSLDRKRKRVYSRQGKSEKWIFLNKQYKNKLSVAKRSYYKKYNKGFKS